MHVDVVSLGARAFSATLNLPGVPRIGDELTVPSVEATGREAVPFRVVAVRWYVTKHPLVTVEELA